MLSLIPSEIDIILHVETWEHEESRVPNIKGFVLWSLWNKISRCRGIKGIACYIRIKFRRLLGFIRKILSINTCGWIFHISMLRIFILKYDILHLLILLFIKSTI